ncbi:hypothetical protein DVDV_2394 [Desulfovibrio sp. DV]|nr:hypothetical protein DVDV_2394 [Desulfovibrio sp. DV]
MGRAPLSIPIRRLRGVDNEGRAGFAGADWPNAIKKRENGKKGLPRVWSGGKDSLSRLGKTDATVTGEKKD